MTFYKKLLKFFASMGFLQKYFALEINFLVLRKILLSPMFSVRARLPKRLISDFESFLIRYGLVNSSTPKPRSKLAQTKPALQKLNKSFIVESFGSQHSFDSFKDGLYSLLYSCFK